MIHATFQRRFCDTAADARARAAELVFAGMPAARVLETVCQEFMPGAPLEKVMVESARLADCANAVRAADLAGVAGLMPL